MRLRFGGRLAISFLFLLALFLLIQSYLIHSLKKPFLLSSFVGVLIVLPVAYLIFRFMTQPIRVITELANRIASGNGTKGLPLHREDELGRLAKAIDEMRLQLQRKIEEISEEKDYLQALLGGIMEGVLVIDAKGRIVMVNQALRQLLSLPPGIEMRTPIEVIRNAELEETLQRVVQSGKGATLELVLPSAQEKTFEVNVVGIPSSPAETGKEDETRRGAIALFHDITRLKELEKIRQDFVANVSHELRTPLTTIKGYAETLLEGALKEEVAYQFVQVIKKHSDRLEKIVQDLLMLSKIESRQFRLQMEPLSVLDLVNSALSFLREAIDKKMMTVSVEHIPPALQVCGDQKYLEQVLINLLDNAVKYGRDGGKIFVSANQKGQEEVEISVKDDGIGIPKEDLSRIFERFYRVDKGRSNELGGTGLGLSIVKHIVQAHGGRVWAESQPGQGSTFYVTLPLHFPS